MSFTLDVMNECSDYMCKASGSGYFFAKKGSMVADQGDFHYSKRLLGTNDNEGLLAQIGNHVMRKVTGENLEVMEVKGSGNVYLADQGFHLIKLELEPNGPESKFYIESENILAFTPQCKYSTSLIGTSGLLRQDLFKSKFTYNGPGATIIVKSIGAPIVIEGPCRVDPDALIAWTGAKPTIEVSPDFKMFFGQSSGESYMLKFSEPGQSVIIQPYELPSKVGIGVDANHNRNNYNTYKRN